MCGIAGALGRTMPPDALRVLASDLGASVRHRGPDGSGVWQSPDAAVVLAHRRLAVVALGEQGTQPMTSADGAVTVSFNGEVYDHQRHRAQLARDGVTFRGGSDTETLVELLARVGLRATLSRLEGMFAFAAWDHRRRRLVLARDRMGEKPLYWISTGQAFAFCSEARPLRAVPGAPTGTDDEALASYLQRGFVTGERSLLAGVRRLPAGHWLEVDEQGRVDGPHRWWDVEEELARGEATPLAPSDALDAVEASLRDAVRSMLVADVPLGLFLSGGVDSSLVCALAQAESTRAVSTFTVGFDQPSGGDVQAAVDESGHAAAVAQVLGTEHRELRVGAEGAQDALAAVVAVHGEPFADPSAVPTALLCRATRDHVTVALSGDGADEVFAGYNRHRVASGVVARALRMPEPARRLTAMGLESVPARRWEAVGRRLTAVAPRQVPSDLSVKTQKLAQVLRAGAGGASARLSTVLDPQHVMARPPDAAVPAPARGDLSVLRRALAADLLTTLPDDMLVKVDSASMAVALEVRAPYLDRRVLQTAFRVPDDVLMAGGRPKAVLRDLLARHVPTALTSRPKRGFDPPLAAWLRGPLRSTAQELLSPARLHDQGVLSPGPVGRLLAEHLEGRRDHAYALWTVLVLQAYLDGAA